MLYCVENVEFIEILKGVVSKIPLRDFIVKYFNIRHAGEGGGRRPSCLSVGGAGVAKVPFSNAMICFLIVNMIQRRSYKLNASNI